MAATSHHTEDTSMKVSPMKTTVVCLSLFFCCNLYFLYSFSKTNRAKREITTDIVEGIANEIIKFVARNITGSSKKKSFDCLLGRKHSGIYPLTSQHANGDKESPETNAKVLFYDRLSLKEKVEFKDLIKTFSKGVPSNITYFLYAGALLGSYSHHGMIPWDDDMDIIVREKDKPLLLKFLQSLRPKYEHHTSWKVNWKFYHKKSPKAGDKHWNWPFLDIFFYSEHPSFIRDCRATKKQFNKSDVFPLIQRPFMGMMLPAPRNTRKVLDLTYNIDLCVSNSYDHRLEKNVPSKCVVKLPCHLLKDQFPFVTRKESNNKSIEVVDDIISCNQSVYETTNAF
ncbi:uncharacterized protein RT0683-like isoform X2 [Haliotis rufescens]|uniref:uncharacterized protein RT0683-like isoform X2 n=1 Tax=Haliotis rufescens TaxID=6454 RepID=UPI001EAFE9F4|nr:uncharacterized protein RT0683-like isoform X2 [Haliotis rufescens]